MHLIHLFIDGWMHKLSKYSLDRIEIQRCSFMRKHYGAMTPYQRAKNIEKGRGCDGLIGINGNLLRWIRQLLTGRKLRVVINGVMSDWQEVLSGIPQCSILRPLLFIIFINNLDQDITSKILKFADDTKLLGGVKSQEDIEALRTDFNRLYEWSEKWQMKFNLDKCMVMHGI